MFILSPQRDFADFISVYNHRSASTAPPPTALSILQSIFRQPRPVASIYRGLAPNLIGNACGWGSFFLFKSQAERALLWNKSQAHDGLLLHDNYRLAPAEFFVASALAGSATVVLTNPIWVLKTRLLSTDRTAANAYSGFISGSLRLWREEGLRGFYRGLGASLLGVSHGAVQFSVYEPVKRIYLGHRPTSSKLDNDATVVISTLAKIVAGAVTYPHQVIRSRMQNHEAEARFGKGIMGVVSRTWREEGPRGFYRGVVLGMVRVMPATWVTFLVYENVRFYLPKWIDGAGRGACRSQ